MKTSKVLWSVVVALTVAGIGLGCSSDPGQSGTGGGGGSAGGGSGGGGTGGGGAGGGGTGGGGAAEGTNVSFTLTTYTCFTLATGAMSTASSCVGDLTFLQGVNVDIEGGSNNICPLSGTFTSLAQLPSTYSACSWTQYIEAMNGISQTGYIVADTALTHHYRFLIVSDVGAAIQFRYSKID